MAATASKSIAGKGVDDAVGLAEIWGEFDLVRLNEALERCGCVNDSVTLKPEWRGGKLLWRVDGKLEMQGVMLGWHQFIYRWLSAGINMAFMRINARHDFALEKIGLILGGSGDVEDIEEHRCKILYALGFHEGHWSGAGFGDTDCYIRLGDQWPYCYKFRSITAGIRAGILIPSGASKDINRPPSIPFGGDGFWGAYGALDLLFELREDLKIGFFGRLSKRFARRTCRRFSLFEESPLFGAARARVDIDPGLTAIASPYVLLEHLRRGFGLGAQYTIVIHQPDSWSEVFIADARFRNIVSQNAIQKNTALAENTSYWATGHVTLNAFYNFDEWESARDFAPLLTVSCDWPVRFFATKQAPHTYRVYCGFKVAF